MNNKSTNQMFFCILILISFIKLIETSSVYDQNVKYDSTLSTKYPQINISYINMKILKDYSLDVTPLTTKTVNSSLDCIKECMKHKGTSLDVESLGNSIFNCFVYSTDYYQNKYKLKVKHGSNHFIIVVSFNIHSKQSRVQRVYNFPGKVQTIMYLYIDNCLVIKRLLVIYN